MKIPAFTAKKKFWLFAGAALLAAGAGILAAALAVRAVQSNAKIIAESRLELSGFEAERSEVRAAAKALKGLEREREVIASSFIDPARPLPFIESVEELGRRTKVRVELAFTSGPAGADGRDYVVSALGSFPQVMAFLKQIESLPFIIALGDLELGRASASGEKGAAEVRLILAVRIATP